MGAKRMTIIYTVEIKWYTYMHMYTLNLCLITATKVSKIMVNNVIQLHIQYGHSTSYYWPKAITYNFCDQLWDVIFQNNIIDTDE